MSPRNLALDFVVTGLMTVRENMVDDEAVDTVLVFLEDLWEFGKLDCLLEICILHFPFSRVYRELSGYNLGVRNLIFVVDGVWVLIRIEQLPLVVPSIRQLPFRTRTLLFLITALQVLKFVL